MIQHIVLHKLKPGTTDEQVLAAFQAGQDLPNQIPGVVDFMFGRDHSGPDHGFTVAAIVHLEDEDALREYLSHPARLRFVEDHMAPITDTRIEIDVPAERTYRPAHQPEPLTPWSWEVPVRDLDEV